MSLLSLFKATVLAGADGVNALVGGPQPFTRLAVPDPSGHFVDHQTRRDFIAAAAEQELDGFVVEGNYFAQKPNDLGDAAIWQGVYTAMTVMRWNARQSPEAQTAMQKAAAALARFFYPTGPGVSVLCRGAVPVALEGSHFHIDQNNASKYFTDGYLGEPYAYREDASLDSLLGACFGAAIVKRFGDVPSNSVLAMPLARFARGFKAAGYRLTNRDGSRTRYGDCAPGFAQAPVRILAAALPSLLAGTLCGSEDWRDIAAAHGPEFATTDTQVPGRISYVNAHLAILANLAWVAAAPQRGSRPAPGTVYAADGLRKLLEKYSDAGNAFLVHAAARLGVAVTRSQKDKANKVLLEFPLGPKPAAGLNSSVAPALQPVPVWQRPPADVVWQRSPYPYSGSESHAYNRMDYLLAHFFERRS